MILRAIFNNDKEFKLTRWSYPDFKNNLNLYIQSLDIVSVKEACSNIHSLDIYQDQLLIASFTSFDSFDCISYVGSQYVDGEGIFAETLSVTLTKLDFIRQIERLDEKINPVVDIDVMDVDAYREYKLKEISDACTAEIYRGDRVVLSDGHVETFSFDDKDQADLQALSNIAMMNPEIELTWHSNGNACKFYSGVDIIIIYQTLNMKLFRLTTICNALNMLIKSATTKEEIMQYFWGCGLPDEEQARVDALISKMESIVSQMMSNFVPDMPTQSEEDGSEDDENENENDAE